jgi:F-type H+-transporting ATPase subunit gamma
MSRRRDIDSRLGALADIGKIMRSMQNLSYLETRKLARFLASQRRVVAAIDTAARDFLGHYPGLPDAVPGAAGLYVLIGAERGFCGSFNEAVLSSLKRECDTSAPGRTRLVAVGAKLASALGGDPRLADWIPGAAAAEEVPAVLERLLQCLERLGADRGIQRLSALHWDVEREQVASVSVLPPFRAESGDQASAYPFPPQINLSPQRLLARLVEHYLFAALHELLYASLMAEHQHRVRHLQAALGRIDERVQGLRLRRNALRQEEITEEIELILLNQPAADRPLPDSPPAEEATARRWLGIL